MQIARKFFLRDSGAMEVSTFSLCRRRCRKRMMLHRARKPRALEAYHGRYDFAHPNCIVVQLATDTFLCVTGFTPGKEKYERAKDAEFKQGIWGPAFAVEIDHAKHLTPVNPKLQLHVCGYVCHTAEMMTSKQLQAGSDWGMLSTTAVREIAEGLLGREGTRSFLPKKAVAALKLMLRT